MHWHIIYLCFIKSYTMTASIIYEGNLRSRCTHIESGTEILTDAPKDNHGNGAGFLPY